MKKKILVTGGAGFLGSHLCETLLNNGHDLICVDNLFTGSKENVQVGEKNLRHGIQKVFQLYVFLMNLLKEVHGYSKYDIEKGKKKKLPIVRVTFVKTSSNSNEIQEFIKLRKSRFKKIEFLKVLKK